MRGVPHISCQWLRTTDRAPEVRRAGDSLRRLFTHKLKSSLPADRPTFMSDFMSAFMTAKKTPAIEAALLAATARSLLFSRPGFLIRRLHQIHSWLFSEETSAFNITPVQYSLLTALLDHGEMDQNTLAIEIGLERTSVAEVLPRLEAREVIERRQSPHDKRVKLVKLSRKGRSLLKRMEPAALRAHARTIEHLPEQANGVRRRAVDQRRAGARAGR